MGIMGGGGLAICTRSEAEPEMGGGGGGFIMGGWETFKALDIVDRGVLTPLFHEKNPMLHIPPFSNVVHPPTHTHTHTTSLSLPTPTSTVLSVVMFL